jgi:hypothetical protein
LKIEPIDFNGFFVFVSLKVAALGEGKILPSFVIRGEEKLLYGRQHINRK